MHLIALHDSAGSGNPIGTSGNYDRLAFAPYYIFKDLITIFILLLVISLLVFFTPNFLGDSENYVIATYPPRGGGWRCVDFSYCQNELLATNHQIVGKSLKLFQPNKNGNISYGTGNDSWYGKIETDYHNLG